MCILLINFWPIYQTQPLEVFCKTRCFYKLCKIHRKISAPEILFYKNCRPEARNFIKKEALAQVLFCEFCEISKNTVFTEHLLWLLLNIPLLCPTKISGIQNLPGVFMGCKMGTLARNGGKWTTITNIDILKVINTF